MTIYGQKESKLEHHLMISNYYYKVTFSRLFLSNITRINLYPLTAATKASPIPKRD